MVLFQLYANKRAWCQRQRWFLDEVSHAFAMVGQDHRWCPLCPVVQLWQISVEISRLGGQVRGWGHIVLQAQWLYLYLFNRMV